MRAISCEVGILPRTHGSALFTRGETQALATATLATRRSDQRIESIMGDYTKDISQSRLVSGATRLQPSTMHTGQAAGAIAALAVKDSAPPADVDPLDVQIALVDAGPALVVRREPGPAVARFVTFVARCNDA